MEVKKNNFLKISNNKVNHSSTLGKDQLGGSRCRHVTQKAQREKSKCNKVVALLFDPDSSWWKAAGFVTTDGSNNSTRPSPDGQLDRRYQPPELTIHPTTTAATNITMATTTEVTQHTLFKFFVMTFVFVVLHPSTAVQ